MRLKIVTRIVEKVVIFVTVFFIFTSAKANTTNIGTKTDNLSSSNAYSHFTWGGDAGASIDLSGHDMSTFDIDVMLGYRNKFLTCLGVGSGVHRAFGSDNTMIPVYALIRTSFCSKPSPLFLNIKAGYSFNTLKDAQTHKGANISIGIGFKLINTKKIQSHIILSYGYIHLNKEQRAISSINAAHIDFAQVKFGVSF
jgi:hypothetical protein